MTEQELKILFPDRHRILPELKFGVDAYQELVHKMVQRKDMLVSRTNEYHGVWILELCRQAQKSIIAFVDLTDLNVFRLLRPVLEQPDLQVCLMLNQQPDNPRNRSFVEKMINLGRLKIVPNKVFSGTTMMVDEMGYFMKIGKSILTHEYEVSAKQPSKAKAIKEQLIKHWCAPEQLVSHEEIKPAQMQECVVSQMGSLRVF